MKKKTIAKLVDEAAVLLQLYVRLKASDDNGYCQCVSCGVIKHYKQMQGGHYVSRTWTATKILEENIHPQCQGCNGPRAKDRILDYRRWMDEFYGPEFVKELEGKKYEVVKHIRSDVLELIEELKEKIKEEESRVCGIT